MALGGIEEIDYKVDGKKYIDIAGKNGVRILDNYTPYLKSDGYSQDMIDSKNEALGKTTNFYY
jgi:hypothetical protein